MFNTDKNNNVRLEGLTYIITSIKGHPIGLTAIPVIMSILIFITAVILYSYTFPSVMCILSDRSKCKLFPIFIVIIKIIMLQKLTKYQVLLLPWQY